MKVKLARITRTVNYVKASAVKKKLFAKLLQKLEFQLRDSAFLTIRLVWLSKVNMLACMYEIKDELNLLFF